MTTNLIVEVEGLSTRQKQAVGRRLSDLFGKSARDSYEGATVLVVSSYNYVMWSSSEDMLRTWRPIDDPVYAGFENWPRIRAGDLIPF